MMTKHEEYLKLAQDIALKEREIAFMGHTYVSAYGVDSEKIADIALTRARLELEIMQMKERYSKLQRELANEP